MQISIYFFLFIICLLYFGVTFLLMSYLVSKKINKSPLVLPKDDSPYGIVGKYFKGVVIFIFSYIISLIVKPEIVNYLTPFEFLHANLFKIIGFALMFISFFLTVIAQITMRNSWRIGIDQETPIEFVKSGIFNYSRNPIFLGMLLLLVGLFFVTPNLITTAIFFVSFILIELQVRFEEDFLKNQFGDEYLRYKERVRRYI